MSDDTDNPEAVGPDDPDAGEEIMDVMIAERENEITQAASLQGQIIALVLVLRDLDIIGKEDFAAWEMKSETVKEVISNLMRAKDAQSAAETEEERAAAGVEVLKITIEFSYLLGQTEEEMAPLLEQLELLLPDETDRED